MLLYLSILFIIVGFIVSLGAVTVIDVLGLLGTKSEYWTEATIRAHKVTKSLIWVGLPLIIMGSIIFFRGQPFVGIPLVFTVLLTIITVNGMYLSGVISPYLLRREDSGHAHEVLPKEWQQKILVSVLISDMGWWSTVLVFVHAVVVRMQ
jgi:hypothetical protein